MSYEEKPKSFEEIQRSAVKETWEQIAQTPQGQANATEPIHPSAIYFTPQDEEEMTRADVRDSGVKIPKPTDMDTCYCRTSYFWLNANPKIAKEEPFDPITRTRRIFPEICDSNAPPGAYRRDIELRENMLKETDSEGRLFWLFRYVTVEVIKESRTNYSHDNVLFYGEYSGHSKWAINSLCNATKATKPLPYAGTVVPVQASYLWPKVCSACGLPRCRG